MNKSIEVLAKTIYGEARGELSKYGMNSLIAIGNVVINRCKKSGKTVEGECMKPRQFSCWNKNDPNYNIIQNIDVGDKIYKICLDIADKIINGTQADVTNGADHYYSKTINSPYWAKGKKKILEIGNHVYYKLL